MTATNCLFLLIAAFLVLAVVVGWDIWLIDTGKESISRWIDLASQANPIIAVLISAPFIFVAGILAGHWWFPEPTLK